MPQLLVIDDDPALLLLMQQALGATHQVIGAPNGQVGWQMFAAEQPDVVILDLMLPDINGLELFHRLHKHDPKVPIIILTARGSSTNAIEAMRLGAFDFLVKPVDLAELRRLIQKAAEIRRLMSVPVEIRDAHETNSGGVDLLVGRSPAMQEIYKMIGRISQRDITVLISGATGTGKELVARAIYNYSARAKNPLVAVDCSAGDLAVELELFGNERRSTNEKQRVGKIEQFAGGTIFLDEIGQLGLGTQSKILRWLQDNRFERVGGSESIASDVRVIFSTSEDLESNVARGTFRPDLYYQLHGVHLPLPPLRQRLDDLPALCTHFLTVLNPSFGKRVMRVPEASLEFFRRYPWPGNIRELQSVIKQALSKASGAILLPEFLPEKIRQPATEPSAVAEEQWTTHWKPFFQQQLERGTDDLYDRALQEMERHILTLILRQTAGNQVKAAKLLGITRGNLRNKMRLLGIVIDRQIGLTEADDDLPAGE